MSTPNEDVFSISRSRRFTANEVIQPFARGLYLDTAGVVTVTEIDGSSQTYDNFAVGIWHPIQFTVIESAPANTRHGR